VVIDHLTVIASEATRPSPGDIRPRFWVLSRGTSGRWRGHGGSSLTDRQTSTIKSRDAVDLTPACLAAGPDRVDRVPEHVGADVVFQSLAVHDVDRLVVQVLDDELHAYMVEQRADGRDSRLNTQCMRKL